MREVDAPIPFSPTLPDVSTTQARRAFRSKSYVALFVLDVKPWADRAGGGSFLSYPFVLVVSRQDVGPIYFVTLEQSVLGTKCLGAFYGDAHFNFGSEEALNDERVFIDRALSMA